MEDSASCGSGGASGVHDSVCVTLIEYGHDQFIIKFEFGDSAIRRVVASQKSQGSSSSHALHRDGQHNAVAGYVDEQPAFGALYELLCLVSASYGGDKRLFRRLESV